MKSPTAILTEYVLEKLPAEPVHKRIQLTRALASVENDKKKSAALNSIAADLARIERRQRKLTFNFKERNA